MDGSDGATLDRGLGWVELRRWCGAKEGLLDHWIVLKMVRTVFQYPEMGSAALIVDPPKTPSNCLQRRWLGWGWGPNHLLRIRLELHRGRSSPFQCIVRTSGVYKPTYRLHREEASSHPKEGAVFPSTEP